MDDLISSYDAYNSARCLIGCNPSVRHTDECVIRRKVRDRLILAETEISYLRAEVNRLLKEAGYTKT